MSDDREQAGDSRGDEPERFDGDEEKGVGLTEEFARLEREIERELGPAPGEPPADEEGAPEPPADEEGAPEPPADEEGDPEPPTDEEGDPVEQSADESSGESAEHDRPDADVAPDHQPDDSGDPDDGSDDEPGAREVRFEETDSSEWVAPTPEPGEGEATPTSGETEEWDAGDDGGGEEPAEAGALDDEPAVEHTVIRRSPPPGVGPPLTGSHYYEEEQDLKNKTPALWWRFLTASVLIVASVATAVAVSSLIFITGVAADLQPIPSLQDEIEAIEPGDPQTILIIGSDERANTPGDPGRSDTAMLLRVDPDNEVLSLLSIPRDLKVQIPGRIGETKFNEAYTIGGIKLTIQTVENLTGLEINNVVNVDFNGFAKAVDAIDCVYVDVDRRYFNDNSTALTEADTYATIHVNAGYQRLCGQNALDYVRYRHSDNDFVRHARQQDFLRNARAQVPVSEVLPILEGSGGAGSDLLKIFTEHTQTSIESAAGVIDVLKTFINVRNVPIKEVHLDAADVVENGAAYVVASPEAIKKAVDEFLGGVGSAGPRGGKVARKDPSRGGESSSNDEAKKRKEEKKKDPRDGAEVISTADLAATTTGGIDSFQKFGRTSARRLKFPVWIPTVVAPFSSYSSDSRQYEIKGPDGEMYPAYKLVIQYGTGEGVIEYYGVQGTTWSDPPILEDPSETETIDGREYRLYYDGDRLRLVAFQDDEGNSYWVSNTLLQTLGQAEMLAIAGSMEESHG